jgi:hypothetical protein
MSVVSTGANEGWASQYEARIVLRLTGYEATSGRVVGRIAGYVAGYVAGAFGCCALS